jgi:hypothetical protein
MLTDAAPSVFRRAILALTQLVQPWSCSAYQTGLQQVELGASVRLGLLHLPLTDLFSKSPCVFELGIVAEPQLSALVRKCCRLIVRIIG